MTRIDASPAFSIDPDAIEEKFPAATGPGGQNVNKVCKSPLGDSAKWVEGGHC
jgi:protein subunit release factor B